MNTKILERIEKLEKDLEKVKNELYEIKHQLINNHDLHNSNIELYFTRLSGQEFRGRTYELKKKHYITQKGILKDDTEQNDILIINKQTFPDPLFRECILRNYDKNHDGLITQEELRQITELDCSNAPVQNKKIKSLEGIQYFKYLIKLDCAYNDLKEIDISQNVHLERLMCFDNKLESLDLSQNKELKYLICSNNKLHKLSTHNNSELRTIDCSYNYLSGLDLTNNNKLKRLKCGDNSNLTRQNIKVNTVTKNELLLWL